MKTFMLLALVASFCLSTRSAQAVEMVDDVRVLILSDMVISRRTHGEWGFSALVAVKTGQTWKKILFDTGGEPRTVLENAQKLKVDLCDVEDVVLSHNHQDHTMGLVTLREFCRTKNPRALSRTYVAAPQIFWPRPNPDGTDDNVMLGEAPKYLASGGRFFEPPARGPMAIPGFPGVWMTGAVPRFADEKTYPGTPFMINPHTGKGEPDLVPEDQALVINTRFGAVVITGCAHSGLINTVRYSHQIVNGGKIHALIGGFHLFQMAAGDAATPGTLIWEAEQLRPFKVDFILGAHCTGFERVGFLRNALHMTPRNAVISSIATTFELGKGITAPMPGVNGPIPGF